LLLQLDRGQCCDHYFRRFSLIFGKNIGLNNVMMSFYQKSSILSQNRQFCNGEKIYFYS
jgi:hypothetical protein